MKTFLSALVIFLFSIAGVSAAIDPYFKEAMQRGYPIEGDSVVLPDGNKCLLEDFNNQVCGKEFFDQPYCVEEGKYVWDEDKCCEGLTSYLPAGIDGQATCQKKGKVDFNETLRNPLLWLGILGFTALLFGSLLLAKKMMRK